jgi:hypothetical protein
MEHTADPANAMHGVHERLSDLIARIARRDLETVKIGDLSRALRDRGFGAMLVLLAAPNLIPMPPGTSTVFGLPMLLIAVQLVAGYRRPLLPRFIRNREISMSAVRAIATRLIPWLRHFEKIAMPRWWLLPHRIAEIVIGSMTLLMGLVLILPIPFGNFLPGAAVVLMCLGLGERDGIWTGAGIIVAILAFGVTIGAVATAGLAVLKIF